MLKTVNLLSLVNAERDLSTKVFSLYLDNFSVKVGKDELNDLKALISEMQNHSQNIRIYEDFYLGYSIKQISKEFDLLRFGNDTIINIELKKENVGEKRIKKQLIRNEYYLSFLKNEIFNYTYVMQENKLYYLDECEELIEVNFDVLISKLSEQVVMEIEDINELFDPSNYLVSPFNSTQAFVEGDYFLTGHQESIKDDILELSVNNGPSFISIYGAAGTGKTLLTYDIAKEYINNSRVLIFHCGSLNSGHEKLKTNYSWMIAPIKNLNEYNLNSYDLIIIDEVQRIYKSQLDKILESIKNINIKCIFSYDSKQCLALWEMKNNIPKYIEEEVSPKTYKLTEKIRTNKEIASFIKNLFDLSKINPNQEYSNINVRYFSNCFNAKRYIETLRQGWKIINYTPSMYENYPYDKYNFFSEDNAHKVIGQEFDKVVAVIDRCFYYDQEGKLATKNYNFYYHPKKMLFQILTRARRKLSIIIIDNEELLNQCLNILNR